MTAVGRAIALAAEVHRDQTDKSGVPYIHHVLEVSRRAVEQYRATSDGWNAEKLEVVCVLHDAFEDFEGEPGELRRLRDRVYQEFGADVYAAVDALTKLAGDDYLDDYIPRVARNWMARRCKLADLSHNLEAWRIPNGEITERDFLRWAKYHRAFVMLMREETGVGV